ncbi:cell division ATP-binding protein FtsE [Coprothermobacter platensis]|uniref:cell division ATP-binding protein FtsE n=1 Tax=Coprothermobacter platensis TaxID=108819 RepID=UPI0003703C26|nr:ABC transporter ATP-binding protein [Coprothermobacter platensis]
MISQTEMDPIVSVKEVTKIYGKGYEPALSRVSFELHRGEFVYLIGPTGAGKTTLLHILLGLRKPTSGYVDILGHHLDASGGSKDIRNLRLRTGVIFQGSYLLNDKTVYENVIMSLEVRDYPVPEVKRRAEAMLYKLGLLDKKNFMPEELSGGQKQLVAFARAILHEPELIIADEPTANLDLNTARELINTIQSLAKNMNTTVLLATHNVELVAEMGNRVIRLEKGRIVFDARKVKSFA